MGPRPAVSRHATHSIAWLDGAARRRLPGGTDWCPLTGTDHPTLLGGFGLGQPHQRDPTRRTRTLTVRGHPAGHLSPPFVASMAFHLVHRPVRDPQRRAGIGDRGV